MRLMILVGWIIWAFNCQAQVASVAPLEDALWKGLLTVTVTGDQFNQFTASQVLPDGRPELIKEKGKMAVDLKLQIDLLVNALGDAHIMVHETFNGTYSLTHQRRQQIKEDKNQNGIITKALVQVSQTRQSDVSFEDTSTMEQNEGEGSVRIIPSGQLDKKGSLEIHGTFELSFDGQGSYYETYERQPPSSSDPNTKKKAILKKTYTLPVSFEMKVELMGKLSTGEIKVSCQPTNPFPKSELESVRPNYNSTVVGRGSFRLDPLFGK